MLTDHVGSVRVVTDSAGEVIGRRDPLPSGDALRDTTDPQAEGAASAESTGGTAAGLWNWQNSVRTMFAGTERDVVTGLEHTPHRKYESGWGRWTSPDPVGKCNLLTLIPSFSKKWSHLSNNSKTRDFGGGNDRLCHR